MTIVVVTGSRRLVDSPARLSIKQHFLQIIEDLGPTEVHHGGAKGPDAFEFARFMEVPLVFVPVKLCEAYVASQIARG